MNGIIFGVGKFIQIHLEYMNRIENINIKEKGSTSQGFYK